MGGGWQDLALSAASTSVPGPGLGEWSRWTPDFAWRPSQQHLLELAAGVADRRWHLCAPPGAGKTLIGLELARQVAAPTLVLVPTTAIRDQWRQSAARFGVDPVVATSDDVGADVPLRCVTYQLLGNPGAAAEELEAAARRLWHAEVAAEVGDEAADARIAAATQGDPARARKELGRHVRALRRSLATGDDVGVPKASLLGERTTALVDQLAASGLGCLVLDECHHLLDWWALVVAALVERVAGERPLAVVGLTATLPDAGSAREAANYEGLLGPVDAELHLAAMVAEGGVAPWRDGIRAVPLTQSEEAFVADLSGALCAALDQQLVHETFLEWAVGQVEGPATDARLAEAKALAAEPLSPTGDPARWDTFWDRDPLAAAGLARWWAARGLSLPSGFDPPPEALGPFDLPARLAVVDAWLHDPDAELPAEVRTAIDEVASQHGLSFTTRGVRWGRSAADLVCARSAAKGPAAATVLAEEAVRRGAEMRALVVVDRDQATTAPAAAREVLGEDAGTAAVVLAALCAEPEVAQRGVLAVTGRGAWCDALGAEAIRAAIGVHPTSEGRWVTDEGCDVRGAVRLVGHGGPWSPARWLLAAEAAMGDGAAQVLLATRGLVGEGWDHPALNVLVDLSEATGAGATTQLRGRALRLDPDRPDKVASLWDVVAVSTSAPGDWNRMRRRHRRWWGPDAEGRVVTGAAKLHPGAEATSAPSGAALDRLNAESAAAVADEAATRAAWAAVDPGGVATEAVEVRSARRRSVRTRPAGWRTFGAGAGVASAGALGVAGAALLVPLPLLWPIALAAAAGAVVAGRAGRGRDRGTEQTLQALGDAVRAGLVAVGDAALAEAQVDVDTTAGGEVVAVLVGADDAAATRWADALSECLGPLERPRWMVTVQGSAWRVPTAVGATREAAEAFHGALRHRLPGAHLVRAGTPEATELVLAARAVRPDEVERTLRWR
jgi:superfamily II DNA or RNA helicase